MWSVLSPHHFQLNRYMKNLYLALVALLLLSSCAVQKPEKLILLAKLLDSDFDMTGFEKQVRTKHAREIKQRHISSNKIYKKSSSGSSLLESLEDFI